MSRSSLGRHNFPVLLEPLKILCQNIIIGTTGNLPLLQILSPDHWGPVDPRKLMIIPETTMKEDRRGEERCATTFTHEPESVKPFNPFNVSKWERWIWFVHIVMKVDKSQIYISS